MHTDKSLRSFKQAITDEGLVQAVIERGVEWGRNGCWQHYNQKGCQWQGSREHQLGRGAATGTPA